ncbi:ABC transporter ATP-binding protein [Hathewaya limosa]|uniref:ATP-binding cassette subfamily B protein n=1 Tax=Hathewaya limosa TaxID=1536 RepID=A0ABU0JUX9_HATLI|nr:ABC transporter ATP-binding protein [Hathewaya limosa]MDQ0480916.1 ATP-binding cassette subfamily B protein [Hathewaya limosa]
MIKRFISYYKPHRRLFIFDLICAFLMASLDLVFPMVTREILNNTLPNKNTRQLYIFVIILIVIYLVQYMCSYFMQYWGHVIGVRMQYDMRKDIFYHLQTLSFSFFDENKTGHIMSRIINDLMEVSELAHHGPEDLFISIVMIIGSFISLCTINVQLTLIIFSFIPFLIWFTLVKRKKLGEVFGEVRKKVADVNSRLENSISGIRVSKSFTNEKYEIEKFDKYNKEFKEVRSYAYKYMAEFFSGIKLIIDLLQVITIGAGGYFYIRGKVSMPDIVAYLLYINFFMQPIRRLANFIEQYQSGMAGFRRFDEIMNVKPNIVDKEDAITLENVEGNIQFKNVSFSYDDTTILDNLSIGVPRGKCLALVGTSGGGKTTICHLIPRFYEVEKGKILLDGVDIRDIKLNSLRKNIGIVQQEVFLFTGTIKENILYGNPEAKEDQVIQAAKNANIHEYIISLKDGYETNVGEKGLKLSGGQKQRIAIARVFLKNPPILILDEATSALDNETEIAIQSSLEQLSNGRTTLIVAHRLSTVKNADNILVLTKKGIEEEGNHEKLMKHKGIYAKLYNAQFKGNNNYDL